MPGTNKIRLSLEVFAACVLAAIVYTILLVAGRAWAGSPASESAHVAVVAPADSGPVAAAVAPTDVTLPPPVAQEPTDVGSALGTGTRAVSEIRGGQTLAGLAAILLVIVYALRWIFAVMRVRIFEGHPIRRYALVAIVAVAQQAALVLDSADVWRWGMVWTILVAALAAGKLWDHLPLPTPAKESA